MQILIQSIKMPIGHSTEEVLCAAREIVRSRCICAKDFWIYKQSIDARKKKDIHYVYTVAASVPDGTVCDGTTIKLLSDKEDLSIPTHKKLKHRPVVVGMGPCGLFAAYVLAKSGNPPLLLERGDAIERRQELVEGFWSGGALDAESNVQFGEGGAGTFSDGKLNTRISDPRQRYVLKVFVEHGGPEDILYKAKPHIGTDRLRTVIRSMREEILRLGGEIRFRTCLTGLKICDGVLREIELNHSESMPCGTVVLAIGHSSRDTYHMLQETGLWLEPKPFAVGLRVEHTQRSIDAMQYGDADLGLPPADYRLVYNGKERSCYSFCMCPGGQVINASSEEGRLVINGMSHHDRDGKNANSALVVTVRPEDFESKDPLGGLAFQRTYEELAYQIGGGDGSAPVQRTRDFLLDVVREDVGEVVPSFTGKWRFAPLKDCLPPFVTQTMKEGLQSFDGKMRGFSQQGMLTGVEMRTSAAVRILRNESMQSVNGAGIYPAGEGAGYAGGIVSAAVDGIKVALAILEDGQE